MQPQTLQQWAVAHDPALDHKPKNGFWEQVQFMRDILSRIVHTQMLDQETESLTDVGKRLTVIATHTSRTIVLPVVKLALPDGTECLVRNNFLDWKISVHAARPITCDFAHLFDVDSAVANYACEGFTEEWVFGSYAENNQAFTIVLPNHYAVYTFFWLLTDHLHTAHVQRL